MKDFNYIMSREDYNLLSQDKQLQAAFFSMYEMMIVKDRRGKIYYTKPHTMTLVKLDEKRKSDVVKYAEFFAEAAKNDDEVRARLLLMEVENE